MVSQIVECVLTVSPMSMIALLFLTLTSYMYMIDLIQSSDITAEERRQRHCKLPKYCLFCFDLQPSTFELP